MAKPQMLTIFRRKPFRIPAGAVRPGLSKVRSDPSALQGHCSFFVFCMLGGGGGGGGRPFRTGNAGVKRNYEGT